MSDKVLNKLNIRNKRPGVTFSNEDRMKENRELISELDKRITDLLHKIEFTDANPNQAYKLYMKLQMFLRKKRAIKSSGKIYIPRTETGNYIVDSQVTDKKKNYN